MKPTCAMGLVTLSLQRNIILVFVNLSLLSS